MSAKNFIQSFIQRKGIWVLLSSYFAKAATFLISIFVARYLAKEEFGAITYAATIISFVAPFKGFGIHQGFLRFASISNSQIDKKFYLQKTLALGLKYTGIIIGALLILSTFITNNLSNAFLYLVLLSLQLIGLFLIDTLKIYTRVIGLNKLFSSVVFWNNLTLVIGAISLTYLFGGLGYITALVLLPVVVGIVLLFKLNALQNIKPRVSLNKKEFINYGLFMSIGGVLSQLLYAVDIMLIANILKESSLVAEYKVANIIPFSLLILPVAILTTDYVKISNEAEKDRSSIWKYYGAYLKIMSLISVGIIAFFYFCSDYLMLLFGEQYNNHNNLMFIFSIGVVGALLFRIPLGNILAAVGWPKINALFSLVILLINLVAGYYCVTKFGVFGAAYTTIALMWCSGILSLFALIYYVKSK